MKTLYLCFTPYHIKVANYFAKLNRETDENHLYLTSSAGIPEEKQRKFVETDLFRTVDYADIELSLRKASKEGFGYFKRCKARINSFVKDVEDAHYEKIVYFSDDPIAFQIIFNHYKQRSDRPKFIFIEEGLGLYSYEVKFPLIYRALMGIARILFRNRHIKVYMHGKGGFEDEVILREPELFESKGKKIKLTNDDFRKIIDTDKYTDDLIPRKGVLFCPSFLIHDVSLRNEVFSGIFAHYTGMGKTVYVKIHPSEQDVDSLRKMLEEGNSDVIFISRDGLTAEDIILNPNINEVVSDLSTALINTHYLREDVKMTSYYYMLIKKYKMKFNFGFSIFDNMIQKGIIERYMGY